MRKLIAFIFIFTSLSTFSQNANYKGWGFNGDVVGNNTSKFGTTDNRSVYFTNNDSIWGKRDSVGRVRVFISRRSTSLIDQTWQRWGIVGAAYTGSFGAVYDGFWIGTTSGHNLNLFTRGNLPAVTISSLTSGAVNAVKINPLTYTHNAQFCVVGGGGVDIVQFKNNLETANYFRMIAAGDYTFTGAGTFSNAAFSSSVSSGGYSLSAGGYTVGSKAINTSSGDAATIDSPIGRFRKDNSGSVFTLTNNQITANSIITLQRITAGLTGGTVLTVQAGTGSATITFEVGATGIATAPSADCDVNFIIIN